MDNVWCDESACFGLPAVTLRSSATVTTKQILEIRSWLITLSFLLLAIIICLAAWLIATRRQLKKELHLRHHGRRVKRH
jgi:hypothetical protein